MGTNHAKLASHLKRDMVTSGSYRSVQRDLGMWGDRDKCGDSWKDQDALIVFYLYISIWLTTPETQGNSAGSGETH